jgi:hypothetical protein
VTGNPWDKSYRPRPLNPQLYDPAQVAAAAGDIRPDRRHPAWVGPESDALAEARAEANRLAMQLGPDAMATKAAIKRRDELLGRRRLPDSPTPTETLSQGLTADRQRAGWGDSEPTEAEISGSGGWQLPMWCPVDIEQGGPLLGLPSRLYLGGPVRCPPSWGPVPDPSCSDGQRDAAQPGWAVAGADARGGAPVKSPMALESVAGLRGRLDRFGLDIEERGGTYRIIKVDTLATFETLDMVRAFVTGAESVVMTKSFI